MVVVLDTSAVDRGFESRSGQTKNYIIGICLWGQEVIFLRLLFSANSAIFHLYHDKNRLIFNGMMMRSDLYYSNTLSWISIVRRTIGMQIKLGSNQSQWVPCNNIQGCCLLYQILIYETLTKWKVKNTPLSEQFQNSIKNLYKQSQKMSYITLHIWTYNI
jgi:hypothetical protein